MMNYQLIIKVLPWIFLFVIGTLFGERITRFFNITKDENVDWIFGILFIANIFYLIYKSFNPRISYDNLSVDDKRIINSLGIYTPILFLIIYYFFFRQDLIPFSFTNALYYFDVVIISFAVINFSYTRYLAGASKHDIKDELNRNIVVEQIKAEILNNSKSKYSSYNIAITGEWGIGKTFIKNELIKKLNDDVETPMRIIDFHPWSTRKSIDIDEQFVQQLSSQVKDLEIKYSLGRYFDQFFNVNNSFIANAFKSIKEIFLPPITKQELGDIIQSNQAIVTFIDDIDRLEKEEIIELFKFIRNNGDIPHLIYVLIYDVDHLTKVLDLKDYQHYIAKFIDIEIDLYRGKLDYIKVFEDNLKNIDINYKGKVTDLLKIFKDQNDEIHNFLIGNLRILKLFSRKVSFQINLKKNFIKNGFINLEQLIFLEIIKFKFPIIFNTLKVEGFSYIHISDNISKLISNKELEMFKELYELFKKYISITHTKSNNINNKKNHNLYFNDFIDPLKDVITKQMMENDRKFSSILDDYIVEFKADLKESNIKYAGIEYHEFFKYLNYHEKILNESYQDIIECISKNEEIKLNLTQNLINTFSKLDNGNIVSKILYIYFNSLDVLDLNIPDIFLNILKRSTNLKKSIDLAQFITIYQQFYIWYKFYSRNYIKYENIEKKLLNLTVEYLNYDTNKLYEYLLFMIVPKEDEKFQEALEKNNSFNKLEWNFSSSLVSIFKNRETYSKIKYSSLENGINNSNSTIEIFIFEIIQKIKNKTEFDYTIITKNSTNYINKELQKLLFDNYKNRLYLIQNNPFNIK